ncbi:hypothetical protein TWF718_010950 [Orbilia javanica]|uniref:Uncharacterized protein n=1 Tax=Orbilia javanica TaxID=47235 RepID=A0AAN8MN52_9PEZI
MGVSPLNCIISLRYLITFFFVFHFSRAQVPPDPDPNTDAAATDNTATVQVPLIRHEGDFIYIRMDPEFEDWLYNNQKVLSDLNDEIYTFAEVRNQLCPLGINPSQQQTINQNKDIPQTTQFSFGYLVYTLRAVVEKLAELNIASAATEAPDIPLWLRKASRILGKPPAQAKELYLFQLNVLRDYAETLQTNWEALDRMNQNEFSNASGFFPQPAPFGTTGGERRSRILNLIQGIFGGLGMGPELKTAMINFKNLKFKAEKWKKRSEALNERTKEAALWVAPARVWKMDDITISDMLDYYKYFPMWEETVRDVTTGKMMKKATAITLFENIWAWYGCWAAQWERIVRVIDQLTPLPGLEDLDLEYAPTLQEYTVIDKIEPKELYSDSSNDPKFKELYMSLLLEAPQEDLSKIPAPSPQDEGINMVNLRQIPAQMGIQSSPGARERNVGIAPISDLPGLVESQAPAEPMFQIQPQVQIQDEPQQAQILLELEPSQGDISIENPENLEVSDTTSRNSRMGGKSFARLNRKPKGNNMEIEEE